MSDYRLDKLVSDIETRDSIFLYEKITRMPLAVSGNIHYASGTTIGYSTDYGKTFTELTCPIFTSMHITSKMVVYGFVKEGDTIALYRSTNMTTFTKVELSTFGNIDTVTPYGFDSNGDVFIFGEKKILTGTNPVSRIFRTTDGGNTFTAVLSLPAGHGEAGKIGHIHNVSYLGGGMLYNEPDYWLATTGDHNINIKWFLSADNGATWEEIDGVNGQQYRTVCMNRLADQLIWATDAVPGTTSGIYSADMKDILNTTKLIQAIPLTSWGCTIRAKGVCVTVREGNWQKDGAVYIYATEDAGQTWKIEKEIPIRNIPVNHEQPGFHYIIGPDGEGSYFVQGVALRGVTALKIKNKPHYFL